ncbi:MAG: Fic family protein [Erysipelotrichaceae bacterium]|nr:Fic family protein [Erysipelotrichaceae bacterium]
MRNFDYSKLANKTWDNTIMAYIANIYEYKGKQELYVRQKPIELDRLVEIAKAQSTEASNEIEGIVTTRPRFKQLMNDKTTPRNRSEQEILGYRNTLNIIHESYDYIPIKPNNILQLHRELLRQTELSYGGKFKNTPNEIDAIDTNGNKTVLFKPLDPFETPDAIERLCETFNREMALENVEPLILICNFILDFLCIHPFNDGNGRMSRLLTLLLLYQSGFIVGKYISIEKAIADNKELYYEVLQKSDENWHEETNDPTYFIKYMLGIILGCYRDFEERITIVEKAGTKSTSYDIVKKYVENTVGKFTKNDALIACPSLGSSSVESALKKLVEDNTISRKGSGKNTFYVRNN